MNAGLDLRARPAVLTDTRRISLLIQTSNQVHRHLEWRNPLERIGNPPFFVLEINGQIESTIACPPEPPTVAWLRLFVNSGKIPIEKSWEILWEKAVLGLQEEGKIVAASIVLHDWLTDLLVHSGFICHQSIIMLERDGGEIPLFNQPDDMKIREMMPFDLPAVAEMDALAFELIWRNSLAMLEQAYSRAVWPTILESEGRVDGYQLSTRSPHGLHLARLAIRPAAQGKKLGYALTAHLIQMMKNHNLDHLTVNTQSDNAASLALYHKLGFHVTGEHYPVYERQIPN
jgi:ribosomal protein S18 acetylase RimI-like enzyme